MSGAEREALAVEVSETLAERRSEREAQDIGLSDECQGCALCVPAIAEAEAELDRLDTLDWFAYGAEVLSRVAA